jgi:indolepyruvate ferredoxin oxidoreductase beta subunit
MKNDTVRLPLPAAGPATERPISIAIVAMGGQGGGVLTDWIVKLAENQGWVAQSTSVPGVAQRTGATIYYVEMMPSLDGRKPILAQMPTPGDVDVVIASEFMEAGRSILRGIVTPGRTTLIASGHRSLAISEKIAPGDGVANSSLVSAAIGVAAKREIVFDMEALAAKNGSVISSAMFGALATTGVLPFAYDQYVEVIRGDGRGVEASIRTFDAAFRHALQAETPPAVEPPSEARPATTTETIDAGLIPLLSRMKERLPDSVQAIAEAGLRKVVDYQDFAYGVEYLDILDRLCAADKAAAGDRERYLFTVTAAKYLANAMTYDDVIRVADLKTRHHRRARVESEVGLRDGQVLQTTEFMHPRMEEVKGALPVGIASWIAARPSLYGWLDRRVSKGRRVKTYSLRWFLVLYFVGGLRGLRRRSLRHKIEMAHRDKWIAAAMRLMRMNYQLGVEVLQCQRLIKGYSDTHVRGLSKFDKVMATIDMLAARPDAADWARRLREGAIKDASEEQLDGTIATIKTFL